GHGTVGISGLQMYERLPDAPAQFGKFLGTRRAHQCCCRKNGTSRSGISTHVSPSGMFMAASASASVTTQPCTTHDSRSVRYSVGDPCGAESGSLATRVSSMSASCLEPPATCRNHILPGDTTSVNLQVSANSWRWTSPDSYGAFSG